MQEFGACHVKCQNFRELNYGYTWVHWDKQITQLNKYIFKDLVLVFRGTLPWDIKNWISDINFVATTYPLCDNSTWPST